MSIIASARKVFILGGLILLLWLAGVLLLIYQVAAGMAPYEYWPESVVRTLVFSAVGSFLATRRPSNPIGWLFIAVGLLNALQLLCGEYAYITLALGPERLPYGPTAAWLSDRLQSTSMCLLFFVLLLFPTGRLLSSRWRIVAWVGVCAASVGLPSSALVPSSPFPNPFGVDAAIFGQLSIATQWLLTAALLGAILSLVMRFVRSRGEERQQIKWFVAASVLGFFALFEVTVVSNILPKGDSLGVLVGFLQNLLWIIVPASLPIAVGIAILRYRLYDIDLIINRTLVYGTLTVLLVGLYAGTIVVLQEVFRALTGQQPGLAIVASTLMIAALFTPFRRLIQAFIDRRFYRRKYDARKTLESFSTKLRNETDAEALNNDLLSVVRETCNPPTSRCGCAPIGMRSTSRK